MALWLARLAPYKLIAELVVFGALLAGAVVLVHNFLEHERDIGRNEVRAEWDKAAAAAKDAAVKTEADWRDRVAQAETKGNDRDQINRNLAVAAAGASAGLRDTLATIRSSVPSDTAETLRSRTVTLASLLGECQGRYRELASHADGHASDVQTLSESWPTQK